MKTVASFAFFVLSICWEVSAQPVSFDQIYWVSTGGEIVKSNVNSTGTTQLFSTGGGISDFVVDQRVGRVFTAENSNITSYALDGSGENIVFRTGAFLNDVELDPIENFLYYTDIRNNVIGRVRTDGSDDSILLPAHGTPSNVTGTRLLSIDVPGRKLYWIEKFGRTGFWRSNLDGTSAEQLFSINLSATQRLSRIIIDSNSQTLFYATSAFPGEGKIWRSDLDGSNKTILVDSNLWGVSGLAYDHEDDLLYYSDVWSAGPTNYDATINVLDLSSQNISNLYNFGPGVLDKVGQLSFAYVPEPCSIVLHITFSAFLLFQRQILR